MLKKTFLLFNTLILLLLMGCFDEREIIKDHQLSNDDISFYFTIKGTPQYILDFEGHKQLINSYDVYITFEQKNNMVEKVKYQINYINAINERFRLFDNLNSNGETLPFNKQLLSQNTIGGNGFKEFFGVIQYEQNNQLVEFNFYEKILLLETEEINLTNYIDQIQSDLFNFYINVYEKDDLYQINMTIETLDNKRHIDFQTWFVDENHDIYPFVGIYNYFSPNNMLTIFNNQLYKDIKVTTLYLQMHYFDVDENQHISLWKISIDDLKANAIK